MNALHAQIFKLNSFTVWRYVFPFHLLFLTLHACFVTLVSVRSTMHNGPKAPKLGINSNIANLALNLGVFNKNSIIRSQTYFNLPRYTEFGTYHKSQIGMLWSWAHSTADSHRIRYFLMCLRLLYLRYNSDRYTGILGTCNVRFTLNSILCTSS